MARDEDNNGSGRTENCTGGTVAGVAKQVAETGGATGSAGNDADLPRCVDRESLEKARAAGFNVDAFLEWLPPWVPAIERAGFLLDSQQSIMIIALSAFTAGELAGLHYANRVMGASNR